MSILTADDAFDLAIRVEENGAAFYKKCAESFDDPASRELFSFLASEETRHRDSFETMRKGIKKAPPATGYPDEYADYLQAYADRLIFTDPALDKEIARLKDVKDACEFGIRRELDSILYYQEIKTFVPDEERTHIDDIITEERRHFMKLTEMKKQLH